MLKFAPMVFVLNPVEESRSKLLNILKTDKTYNGSKFYHVLKPDRMVIIMEGIHDCLFLAM